MNAHDTPETALLLVRAAGGDIDAWGALLAGHQERLQHVVSFRLDPRLRGRVDAADVIQEAFIAATERRLEFFRQVPAAGVNRRLCTYGALDYRSGRVRAGALHGAPEGKDAQQFHEFPRQLLEADSERRLVLVISTTPATTAPGPSWRCWRTTPTTCS